MVQRDSGMPPMHWVLSDVGTLAAAADHVKQDGAELHAGP